MNALRMSGFLVLMALAALAGCSSTTGGVNACPGCGLRTVAVTYTGTFVQGAQRDPVRFTAPGQTATVLFTTTQNGNAVPPAPVTGTFSVPCPAATVEPVPAVDGQLTIRSTASGTCTLLASSNFGQISVGINVP